MSPSSGMITRRPIIWCILSLLLFLAGCGLGAQTSPSRTVRVKAMADPAMRARNPAWEAEIRGLIEASSDYFEEEFGIQFVTQSAVAWPPQEKLFSTAELMMLLKKDFPPDPSADYDLIVSFTAEQVNSYRGGRGRVDRIGNCREGLSRYLVTYVSNVFRYTGATSEPSIDVIGLIHEFGHVFGAEHTQDINSIMNENFDYRSDFDAKNREVILQNRNCPFAK